MSSFLPSFQTFIKVRSEAIPVPGSSFLSISIQGAATTTVALGSLGELYNLFSIHRAAPDANILGVSLLYYGQEYLIYPSAFPPGSRTGPFIALGCSIHRSLLAVRRGSYTE